MTWALEITFFKRKFVQSPLIRRLPILYRVITAVIEIVVGEYLGEDDML